MLPKKLKSISKNVFTLSFVSFFNDVAGETIRRLFPLFLANILGVKTLVIGVIEGVGEAAPHLVEPISGYLSDYFGKRKIFIVIGQILRTSMVLLVFAVSWPQALLIRFLDRTGKGIAIAPRDTLLSYSTKDGHSGESFGLNRTMDNLGATVGTILIIIILLFLRNHKVLDKSIFNLLVFTIALPSLVLALLFIIFLTREIKDKKIKVDFHDHLGRNFYTFLAITFLFSLGNFSDGFLVLRSQEIGISLIKIFILLSIFTFSSTLTVFPVGFYSDHHERRRILALGWLLLAACYIGFGNAQNFWQLLPLFIIYGIYYGSTQGISRAIVTDFVPKHRQGIAFGLLNMIQGIALLPASIFAGYFWQYFNSTVTFYFGAVLVIISAFSLFHVLPHPERHWWEVWKSS